MIRRLPSLHRLAMAASIVLPAATWAQAPDVDPLSLQVTPATEEAASAKASPWRVALELGGGRIDLRGGGHADGRRASIDVRYSAMLEGGFTFTASNRFDYVDPPLAGQHASSNSLRELFVGWQQPGASFSLDAGRINHRQGPAFGYSPTDYFRRGALRSVSTADPVALRERRMGTVMLRAGQLWANGGVTLALAPKVADGPKQEAASLDLGATNHSNRALLSGTWRGGQAFTGQASVLAEESRSPQVGLNFTALATDALVLYGELSAGKSKSLLEQLLPTGAPERTHPQAAVGLTYTFPTSLALTLEADYNRAGLDSGQWQSVLAQGPVAYQRYFGLTQASQELGSRHAWLVYASQKGVGLKQLDLTAFVRTNSVDRSRLLWAELRYHWDRIDGVLQWQRTQGRAGSEFGVFPYRQAVQLSLVFYL